MFHSMDLYNFDLSAWDLSSATNINYIFTDATNFNQVLCWDLSSIASTTGMFAQSSGSANTTAAKCSCVAGEYHDGSACVSCSSGSISFGKTESCVACSSGFSDEARMTCLSAPTPVPTVSFLPTTSIPPTAVPTAVPSSNVSVAIAAESRLATTSSTFLAHGWEPWTATGSFEYFVNPIMKASFSHLKGQTVRFGGITALGLFYHKNSVVDETCKYTEYEVFHSGPSGMCPFSTGSLDALLDFFSEGSASRGPVLKLHCLTFVSSWPLLLPALSVYLRVPCLFY
jgi:hypothetical protein